MRSYIIIDRDILGGTPVFTGTRVPIESLFKAFRHGRTIDYFLTQFPSVKREQVLQLLEDANSTLVTEQATVDLPVG